MLSLLAVTWLSLPLVPLNPVEEDTLSDWNFHLALGASTPNHFVSAGPDLSVMFEKLALHPLVIRSSADYQYGATQTNHFFSGHAHQFTFSLCALYYRGTDHLTGYIGAGPVLRLGSIGLSDGAADSLWQNHRVQDVSLKPYPGYRLILGVRYRESFSLEIIITEVHSEVEYNEQTGSSSYALRREDVDLASLKISFGYLITLND